MFFTSQAYPAPKRYQISTCIYRNTSPAPEKPGKYLKKHLSGELSYEMGGKVLNVSEEERDLGMIMHRSAKPSRQCAEASERLTQL